MRELMDLWIGDFLDRPAAREPAAALGDRASGVLAAFLEAACHGGTAPADLGEAEVQHALLDHLPQLDLEPARRAGVPALVAAFLADLEDQGRLAGGRSLAARARALGPTFRDRAAGHGPNLKRQAPKVGRNEPCPCGSGRKYKACCLNLLG
jgi:transposase